MLEVDGIGASYVSGLMVLKDVSVRIEPGQFVAILGPNGAGKSTLFKTISGTVKPVTGCVRFEGQDLQRVPACERAHLGIAHVPEGRQVFPSLSVMENLEMGAYTRTGRLNWRHNIEIILELMPPLAEHRKRPAGMLSGGQQQMLAIGRGIASSPKLLMLDEPSMGLSPAMAEFVFERLAQIRKLTNLTMLLVEQRVAEALESADRGYVLETGSIVLEGTSEELRANDRVRQAYLGL